MISHLSGCAWHNAFGLRFASHVCKQAKVFHGVHPEHGQALRHESCFAPLAELALPSGLALSNALAKGLHTAPREDFKRTMQVVLTRVEVYRLRWTGMAEVEIPAHVLLEAKWKKHGVWVNLHGPVVILEDAALENPLPKGHKNIRLKACTLFMLGGNINDCCPDTRRRSRAQLNVFVAKHIIRTAKEDRRAMFQLHSDKRILGTLRTYESEAIQ